MAIGFKEYFRNSGVLLGLIAANVGVYFVLLLLSLIFPSLMPENYLVVPASWSAFFSKPWTLLTYMFTQVSFLHLLFNMLWLLWFGRIFLMCASERRLLWAYLGGGLAGSLLFLIVCSFIGTSAGAYLIGSSAAVLSVMTAAAYMAPNLELHLFLLGELRLKYVALICIALTFLGIGGGNAGGFSAHLGGVIFGLFVPALAIPGKGLSSVMEKAKARMKSKKRRCVPTAFADADARSALEGRLSDEERLDVLLDKVRLSGYDSLSASEKRELNAISKKL